MCKPLQGRRIVVTRSPEQAPAFCDRLAGLGAQPIAFATIQFVPLAAALPATAQYDWLIFSSGNAVDFFLERANGADLSPARVAASGSATAAKLAARGIAVDFVPSEFVGEALVAGLGDLAGKRVLLPRAKIGRPEIVALLRRQGAVVDEIPLYDTVTAAPDPAALAELARGVDAITFTSPSSVRNFFKILSQAGIDGAVVDGAVVACIGPVTADAARACGLEAAVVPDAYTIDGLVAALGDFFADKRRKLVVRATVLEESEE